MKFQTLLSASLLIALGGCAYPIMQPPIQLEGGEFAFSGALDMPGVFFVPRAGGQLLYGIGGFSDIGIHANSSLLLNSAGGSLRVYPTEELIIGVQGSVVFTLDNVEPQFFHATARVGRATNADRFFYFGAQSTYHHFTEGFSEWGRGTDNIVAIGGYGGVNVELQSALSVQIEALVNPISIDLDREFIVGTAINLVDAGGSFLQAGVGLTYTPGRARKATPRGTTPAPAPRRDDEPRPTPAPAPPPPEYLDDGVPLY